MSAKSEYKLTLKKMLLHFHMINKHRFYVFRLACKAGIPWRGLVHDLSKYSPTEFFESAKYYTGYHSPITASREKNGYSKAYLHHKGHNKHHYEYWYDLDMEKPALIIPLPYFKEMVCDNLAAGMSYQGKNWTKEYQLAYWEKARRKSLMHPTMVALLTRVYTDVAKYGIEQVVNAKNLEKLYREYTNK